MVKSLLAIGLLLAATAAATHKAHEALYAAHGSLHEMVHGTDETEVTLHIESVVPDGPAAAAGLQAGDYLSRLDGRKLTGHEDLRRIAAAHRPGDTVPLTVWREGEKVELLLTFGQRPDETVSIGVRLHIFSDTAGYAVDPAVKTLE